MAVMFLAWHSLGAWARPNPRRTHEKLVTIAESDSRKQRDELVLGTVDP